ncbi:MAG: phage tail tube protein [Planctomycetota bacterium]
MVTIKKNAAFAYYKEAANKAAPTFANSAGSRLRLLRIVNEDLNTVFQRDESNEVRGDAQSSGSVIVSASGTGSIAYQFSLDTFDDLVVGMLFAADDLGTGREDGWLQGGFTALANILASPASVTFDGADDSFNSAAAFARAPAAGERIYVRGFGNKNLDTVFVVKTGSTTSKIPVENDTGDSNGVDSYAGVTGTVVGSAVTIAPVKGYTRNGTFDRPFGLVRMYSDSSLAGTTSTDGLASCDWSLFRGAYITGFQMACAPGQAGWTGSFSVLFSDENAITDASASTNAGGFDIDNWNEVEVLNANPLTNAITGPVMIRLRKDGGALSTATRVDPLSFNINVSNNASEVQACRNRGAIAIIQGTFGISVAMSLLYIDSAFHSAMLADSYYEVEIGVADADGRCWLFRFPKARLTSSRPNPGKNQPIAQALEFKCEAGGTGFVGAAGTGRMIECLSFYVRDAGAA